MIDLQKIMDNLLVPLSESELLQKISDLHTLYTEKRFLLKSQKLTPELVSAYSVFYLFSHQFKLHYLLDKLPADFKEKLQQLDLYDWGSGPGTMALSFLDYFPDFKGQIFSIEQSEEMRNQHQEFHQRIFPQHPLPLISSAMPSVQSPSGKAFIWGHSFNEMGLKQTIGLIEKYQPEVLFFLEPGTKEVFSAFLPLRSQLLSHSYEILYPCRHTGPCPVDGKSDWCHQTVNQTYPVEFERLTQKLKRDRKQMPSILTVFSRSDFYSVKMKSSMNTYTLFRLLSETKHSFLYEVCGGESNVLLRVEIQKRGLSKEDLKRQKNLTPGEVLSLSLDKQLENGLWRGRFW